MGDTVMGGGGGAFWFCLKGASWAKHMAWHLARGGVAMAYQRRDTKGPSFFWWHSCICVSRHGMV